MKKGIFSPAFWTLLFTVISLMQCTHTYAQSNPDDYLGKIIVPTPLSLNKTVKASSVENSSYPASNAVDASKTTKWSSASSGYLQYLTVDLGAVYDIAKIALTWADKRCATTFDIMISKDTVGNNWQTLKTYTDNTNDVSMILEGLYVEARYVKFNGRGRAASSGYRIADFAVYGYPLTTAAQKTEIQTLTDRILARYATESVTTSNVTSYLTSITEAGNWTDLSYVKGGNWRPHGDRMLQMALAYHKQGNTYYHSSDVRDKVSKALSYLKRANIQESNSDWWYTAISVPEKYMAALMILKNNISKDSLMLYSSFLIDNTPNTYYRGRNQTWVAGVTLQKGCIEDRYPVVNTGYSAMTGCLDVVTLTGIDSEGVKGDNSFHQHYDQLYIGGYGLSFLEEMSFYQRHAAGLSYETLFTSQRKQTLSDLFLNGLQLLSYKKYMDFGSAGRYISRRASMIISDTEMLDNMKVNDPSNDTAYEKWKSHVNGTGSISSDYFGTKYFWKSAILTSHGANFYLSAKVISSRTYGTESWNDENKKGYNLPLGATNIMRTGNEYNEIYPIWQWCRIPGTTAELNEAAAAMPKGYQLSTSDFGGGVSYKDDGIIAYDHNFNGIKAKKAYFFMNNQMVCMGAGINASKTEEIVTSVDQAFTVGTVRYNNGATQIFTGDSLTATSFNWIYHNNIGYLFPAGSGQMTLLNKDQTGKWSDIGTGSATAITKSVFSIYFRHSNTPSNRHYVYIVAPDIVLTAMESLSDGNLYSFPRNETDIQAVRYDGDNKKYAVVFYAAGTIDMGDGMTITSDKKAVVFIKKYPAYYEVSVADPTYKENTILITLNKQVNGTNANVSGNNTVITVNLPTGDYAGSTVTNTYATENASSIRTTDIVPSISVYPNPADTKVTVNFEENVFSTIELIGIDGKICYQRGINTQEQSVEINLLDYRSGIYIVSLKGERKTVEHKLVVTH